MNAYTAKGEKEPARIGGAVWSIFYLLIHTLSPFGGELFKDIVDEIELVLIVFHYSVRFW